jgi:ankyrin repeat protein
MAVFGYDKALHYLVEQKIPLIYDLNYHGKAPIHVAVLNYQPNCIHVLLNAPDMPTCADDEGKNALHYVAQYGDEALLSLVKPYYASFDMLDNEGNTPAELAKRYNLSIAHLF